MAETFGQVLRSFRIRAGLTVSELAEALGASRRSIACWERDRRVPRDRARLVDLAEVLGLSASESMQLAKTARQQSYHQNELAAGHPPHAPQSSGPSVTLWQPPRHHQLRAPVTDFIGRTAEMTQLITALQGTLASGGIAGISSVQGMGGVGKTELAYQVVYQLRTDFPDAQIVINLRGASDAPLTAAQALQSVIHAFTPSVHLPDDLLILEQAYRTLLHNRRVLILADDARDAAQVQPLIPPAGSALLVTSRQRFTLPGMTIIDLEQLMEADAVVLLRGICPRLHLTEAQALARACGYLPLALRVGASILRTNPALSPSAYLTRLTDARQRIAQLRHPDDPQLDVEGPLTASYLQLDPVAQQVFRQLGVFVADFTTELAQAVVIVPEGLDVAPMLEHLLRRNLVMYNDKRARWRQHDLIQIVARRYLEDMGELEAAMWRYTSATVELAETVQRQYLAGGDETVAALASFDADRQHLDAGHSWAVLHAGTPNGDAFLLAFAMATAHIHELRSHAAHDRISHLEQAFAAAERLNNHAGQAQILLSLGRATFDLGSFRQAIAIWERAIVIFQKLGDVHGEGRTLGNVGTAYVRLGDPLRAVRAYKRALVLFRACGDRRYAGHALGNLGAAYAELETSYRAMPYLEKALEYTRTVGDRRFEAALLHALAGAARTQGHVQRAYSVCADGLTIAREIGDRQQEGYSLITLSCIYADDDDHPYAITACDQALTILQELGDSWGVATCRWHYGWILASQGARDKALPLLRAGLAYMEEIGHARVATYRALLTRLEAEEGLPTKAGDALKERVLGEDT